MEVRRTALCAWRHKVYSIGFIAIGVVAIRRYYRDPRDMSRGGSLHRKVSREIDSDEGRSWRFWWR